MATPDDLIHDLLDTYRGNTDHPGDGGPGLITRLDNLTQRTTQPRQTGGHSTPGSRPPASLDAVHWATRIKAEAVILDMELRASSHPQRWDRAMRAIPPTAEQTDRVTEAMRTVGQWHGTCLTVLGLRQPSTHFRHALCLICGARTIYGRADDDRPRAWCTNPECADEDGRPARYDGTRMYLLTTNLAAAS
jgi:hypothetical protein